MIALFWLPNHIDVENETTPSTRMGASEKDAVGNDKQGQEMEEVALQKGRGIEVCRQLLI